jgi:hypothetical protein
MPVKMFCWSEPGFLENEINDFLEKHELADVKIHYAIAVAGIHDRQDADEDAKDCFIHGSWAFSALIQYSVVNDE